MKRITLKDNEELIIPKRDKPEEFNMGCCKCGLTHTITISKGEEVRLKFKRR